MDKFVSIQSKDNQLVKHIVKLAQSKHYRQSVNQAVVYGAHLVEEAIAYNLISKILILDTALVKYSKLMEQNIQAISLVSLEIMKKINLSDSICDILAVIQTPKTKSVDFNLTSLMLENIQDPGNLGTILRAAGASGVEQIILSSNSVDVYNPKVLRASQGIQFGLNIITDINLVELIRLFDSQILALTPHARNSLYDCDLQKPTVFLLGNEGAGLTDDLLSVVPQINHITIPMKKKVESINLAMAATVALFELSRQRNLSK